MFISRLCLGVVRRFTAALRWFERRQQERCERRAYNRIVSNLTEARRLADEFWPHASQGILADAEGDSAYHGSRHATPRLQAVPDF